MTETQPGFKLQLQLSLPDLCVLFPAGSPVSLSSLLFPVCFRGPPSSPGGLVCEPRRSPHTALATPLCPPSSLSGVFPSAHHPFLEPLTTDEAAPPWAPGRRVRFTPHALWLQTEAGTCLSTTSSSFKGEGSRGGQIGHKIEPQHPACQLPPGKSQGPRHGSAWSLLRPSREQLL